MTTTLLVLSLAALAGLACWLIHLDGQVAALRWEVRQIRREGRDAAELVADHEQRLVMQEIKRYRSTYATRN